MAAVWNLLIRSLWHPTEWLYRGRQRFIHPGGFLQWNCLEWRNESRDLAAPGGKQTRSAARKRRRRSLCLQFQATLPTLICTKYTDTCIYGSQSILWGEIVMRLSDGIYDRFLIGVWMRVSVCVEKGVSAGESESVQRRVVTCSINGRAVGGSTWNKSCHTCLPSGETKGKAHIGWRYNIMDRYYSF